MTPRRTMPEELAAAKRRLRAKLARRRTRWTDAQLAAWSRRIARRVLRLAAFRHARMVACYLHLPGEVRTDVLVAACRRAGKRVCVPAYDPARRGYRFVLWRATTPLRLGPSAVREPARGRAVRPEEPDALLVPGVAFDARGGRLGHGAGYYDRLLRPCAGARIGLAFAAQLVSAVPAGARDEAMDWIVTEKQTLRGARATPRRGRKKEGKAKP